MDQTPGTVGLASVGRPRGLDERGVLRIGLLLTAGFVAAAMVAFALPAVRSGHWAGLHLALAGAALVAVGTFMPHFGVTLAGASAESPWLRLAGVLTLALGAVMSVAGVLIGAAAVAVGGASLLWLGLAVTAWTTLRPSRRPLARRHPIAQAAYAVALLQVAVGIGLPVLLLVGWEPAVVGWSRLKPAHVWLNLFGFVSLTISTTLVYLYPTIVGARIRPQLSLVAMIGGGMIGPPLVAGGAAFGVYGLAVAGAALTACGALGQLAYALDVWRRRGRWTTDPGWHRLTTGHLSAAMVWYLVAVAAAMIGIVRDGPAPSGWSLGALAIPLVAGWAMQVLVGAWTHLLPAVGSVHPGGRARQRTLLGLAARPRLLIWNAGVLLGWLGLATNSLALALIGVVAFGGVALFAVSLLLRALFITAQASPIPPCLAGHRVMSPMGSTGAKSTCGRLATIQSVVLVVDDPMQSQPAIEHALQRAFEATSALVVIPLGEAALVVAESTVARGRAAGIVASTAPLGATAEHILNTARAEGADLIVVPSNCPGAKDSGSLSGRLVMTSDRPVLVVQSWARGVYTFSPEAARSTPDSADEERQPVSTSLDPSMPAQVPNRVLRNGA